MSYLYSEQLIGPFSEEYSHDIKLIFLCEQILENKTVSLDLLNLIQ